MAMSFSKNKLIIQFKYEKIDSLVNRNILSPYSCFSDLENNIDLFSQQDQERAIEALAFFSDYMVGTEIIQLAIDKYSDPSSPVHLFFNQESEQLAEKIVLVSTFFKAFIDGKTERLFPCIDFNEFESDLNWIQTTYNNFLFMTMPIAIFA